MLALVVDAILALVLAEALALSILFRVTGNGVRPRNLLANLGSGFSLMLALRVALGTAEPKLSEGALLAACLLAALIFHLYDLARRWNR